MDKIVSMNPQKYCISLDLAKRLHELGVKKRSLFYWSNEDNEKEPWKIDFSGYAVSRNGVEVAHYPAYTSGELGEMLPLQLITGERAKKNQDAVKGWLVGSHEWTTDGEAYAVTVDKIALAPQAIGALFDYVFDMAGQAIAGHEDAMKLPAVLMRGQQFPCPV